MNYAAYGLGQGLSQGMNNNQLVNAMNTASLIQYRRDQQRLQNRYADIAQQNADLAAEKWGMESQALQLALDEQNMKFEQLQKQTEGKDFVNYLYGALQTGDFSIVNSQMHKLKYVKQLADQAGVISFDPTEAYSEESLRNLGFAEGMNLKEYLVVNKSDGTKELINANGLSALLGMGNYYNKSQLDQLYGETTLANAKVAATAPLTAEGIQLGNYAYARQQNLDLIANQQPETISSQKPTSAQIKSQGKNMVQYYIDNFDSFTPEQYKDMISALGEGDTSQQVTLGEKILDSIIKNNPNLTITQLKQNSEFRQVYQYLENSLTKSQLQSLNKSRESDAADNALIEKYRQLVGEKGLKILSDSSIWQKGEDWLRQATTKFTNNLVDVKNQETRQNFQSLFNTLLKITSGGAVTVSEAERKQFELGDLKDQNAITALLGLKNLANELLERKRTRAQQNIVSKYDNMDTMKNLEWYISEIDRQTGIASKNSNPSQANTTYQTQTKEQAKKQVFDMIPNAK